MDNASTCCISLCRFSREHVVRVSELLAYVQLHHDGAILGIILLLESVRSPPHLLPSHLLLVIISCFLIADLASHRILVGLGKAYLDLQVPN
jgi:hypothetical protein